jgi:hypothetical protein
MALERRDKVARVFVIQQAAAAAAGGEVMAVLLAMAPAVAVLLILLHLMRLLRRSRIRRGMLQQIAMAGLPSLYYALIPVL